MLTLALSVLCVLLSVVSVFFALKAHKLSKANRELFARYCEAYTIADKQTAALQYLANHLGKES